MTAKPSTSVFRRPAAGFVLLAAVALVVGLVALPADAPSGAVEASSAPSYATLQDLLREGRGKGLDQGMIDVWASTSPTPTIPTAWVWVVDDTADGDGVEYWAYHDDFAHPGADEDTRLTFGYVDAHLPDSVDDFLDWIVDNYDNVDSPSDLVVAKNTVTLVD